MPVKLLAQDLNYWFAFGLTDGNNEFTMRFIFSILFFFLPMTAMAEELATQADLDDLFELVSEINGNGCSAINVDNNKGCSIVCPTGMIPYCEDTSGNTKAVCQCSWPPPNPNTVSGKSLLYR